MENCNIERMRAAIEELEATKGEIRRLRRENEKLSEELEFYKEAKAGIDEYGRFWLTAESTGETRPIRQIRENKHHEKKGTF